MEKLTLPEPPAGMRWKVEAHQSNMFCGEYYSVTLEVKRLWFWRHVRGGTCEMNDEAIVKRANSILFNYFKFEEAKKKEGIYGYRTNRE